MSERTKIRDKRDGKRSWQTSRRFLGVVLACMFVMSHVCEVVSFGK